MLPYIVGFLFVATLLLFSLFVLAIATGLINLDEPISFGILLKKK